MDKNIFVKEKFKENKIDIVRFLNYQDFYDRKESLLKRRSEGRETEFEEKVLKLRLDPRESYKNTNSIIVLGLNYYQKRSRQVKTKEGICSLSSVGRDYHKVFIDLIEKSLKSIKEKLDFEFKYYVDTGPLIERELALRSGLGYFGKNCQIINEEYGSFIFLAYILTDMVLEEDDKEESDCGSCNLCVKACPTGALSGDYSMDPKKCVSYLTQKKSELSNEERESLSSSIFGCDICQLVCPKNKNLKESDLEEFTKGQGYINIVELSKLSNREFKKLYGHKACSWRGKKILLRNGIINLGNSADRSNIEILEEMRGYLPEYFDEYINWSIEKLLK